MWVWEDPNAFLFPERKMLLCVRSMVSRRLAMWAPALNKRPGLMQRPPPSTRRSPLPLHCVTP